METKQTPFRNKYPVTLEGDTITCYAAFHELLLQKNEAWGITYADCAVNGIVQYWGDAGFTVNIIRVPLKDKRPHINILPAKMTGTSYVMSRWWRWGWGMFTHTLHPETFMINWSRRHPGNIHLNLRIGSGQERFMCVAAHEFGHILGLGDAYAAHYRFYYEAPGTKGYIMNNNKQVSPEEVEMVRKAQATGRMQFFPMKFSARNVIEGMRKKRKKRRS